MLYVEVTVPFFFLRKVQDTKMHYVGRTQKYLMLKLSLRTKHHDFKRLTRVIPGMKTRFVKISPIAK
jgi:hypothetical protein